MDWVKTNRNKLIFLGIYAVSFLLLTWIVNLDALNAWLQWLFATLRPLLIGLVLAYLCNPFFRFYEQKVFSKLRPQGMRRTVSLLLTYLSVFAIIIVLLMMIFPQLISSILDFTENFDVRLQSFIDDLNRFLAWINSHLTDPSTDAPIFPELSAELIEKKLHALLESQFHGSFNLLEYFSPEFIGSIFDFANHFVTWVTDIIFSFFISVYLLSTKEKRYAQIMRLRRALFSESVNESITRVCSCVDRSFGGFFKGKLTDSAIVGVLVYCCISLLHVPYALLIAAVVAITDIIPVIGPFIGIIPSAIIILLTDPSKVIPFLLTILIIQQIDGNVIAPKILGEHTGVSSLCVLIAITTMGALWGFAGMLLGVPVFATILELTGSFLDAQLTKKGLPVQTAYYTEDASVAEENVREPLLKRLFRKTRSGSASTFQSGPLTEEEKIRLQAYALARKQSAMQRSESEANAQTIAEDPSKTVSASDPSVVSEQNQPPVP